ncbi:MAG: imidazoleglycerol-phosphate dehydratase [Candidatus Omnitrophica bacterium]|nr:imidazoleglycerol-phosphate dehydratase [Candidatus Omnitrophota bacterium]
MRKAKVERKTKETKISVNLNIDGCGKAKIDTGIGFLDHMLELFACHGLFDLDIKAKGDFKVDTHHTNEDVGIVLGQAFKKAMGDKKGITRSGNFSWPMEDVLATIALDISGRGSLKLKTPGVHQPSQDDNGYALKDAEHFFESFAKHLGADIHITIDPVVADLHTSLEPVFKALGKALDQATKIDPRRKGIPSTKGVID